MVSQERREPTREEIDEESRQLRRLRIVVYLALETIAQGGVTIEEAYQMLEGCRRIALQMFPGKGPTFDLLYGPKFRRLIGAMYRVQ